MNSIRIIAGLLSMVFMSTFAFANESANADREISVRAEVFLSQDGPNNFERHQLEKFKKILGSSGFFFSKNPQFTFFLGLKNVPNAKDQIAVSVFALHSLPEKMIEAGAKDELFYKTMTNYDNKKLPQEGKFVREYMTSEYLKQFGMITFTDLAIVSRDQLETEYATVIERFKNQNNILLSN